MKLFEINGLGKAGFLPYYLDNGVPVFMFMESSDPSYGGGRQMISKGHIDPGETPKAAAIREAEEELGLKRSNLVTSTIEEVWQGTITGLKETYVMTIFIGQVRSKSDFEKPHYETSATHWMTLEEYEKRGRSSQAHIVKRAHEHLTR